MRFLQAALVALAPTLCFAQSKDVTLDATLKRWAEATKSETPGVSIMPPESLHFSARYVEAPKLCPNGYLKMILGTQGRADFLKKVPVTHCVVLETESGRRAPAFVEDMLVPGLEKDAKVGGMLDLHANLFAYTIRADRSQDTLVLMINEFDPK